MLSASDLQQPSDLSTATNTAITDDTNDTHSLHSSTDQQQQITKKHLHLIVPEAAAEPLLQEKDDYIYNMENTPRETKDSQETQYNNNQQQEETQETEQIQSYLEESESSQSRVKIYELDADSKWIDRGTGFCQVVYDEVSII